MQHYYKLLIVTTIALLTFGINLYDRTNITPATTNESDKPISAQTVPDVTFSLLEGGNLSLHSLSGHTVWLHFWATWCAPCRQEFSSLLERMAKDNGNTILLAVSSDTKTEDIHHFLAPYMHDFKALFDSSKVIVVQDPQHASVNVFQTFKYPETIVIGPDLIMQRKIVGVYKE